MSVLAPLYFFGALAIGLPILFHLIRRQPRGQVEFSSLMFLQPTPPRLTRRSRLDNWLLLLIRALALLLLAVAFARPFLRRSLMSDGQTPWRRMVLLIDTSASMRRDDLWQQALDQANGVIDDLSAGDQLAILTFDREPKTLFGFEQSIRLASGQLQAAARAAIAGAVPTWQPTALGRAFKSAADMAVTFEPESSTSESTNDTVSSSFGSAHIILISDMQEGAKIESLQAYTWPDHLHLDIRRVRPKSNSNAFARILTDRDETVIEDNREPRDRIRVRVENCSQAEDSRFRLAWSTSSGQETSEMPVQVPPGQSRVVRMPRPDSSISSLVLREDAHSFDNRRYLVSPQPESLSLLYVGDDDTETADQRRESLLHYLRLIPLSDSRRQVNVDAIDGVELREVPNPEKTPLVVIGQTIEVETADKLKQYIQRGGQVLFVLSTAKSKSIVPAITRISGAGGLRASEAKIDDYVMLSRIDFDHPLFATMADPKFNDFSKIHFWSHRTISGVSDQWSVLASFDDGQPALLEYSLGDGTLWILTAGWQPSASQLALSTKFLPLVFNFFAANNNSGGSLHEYTIGTPIDFRPSPTAKILSPSGIQLQFAGRDDVGAIDQPGIYHYSNGNQVRTFAANLDPAESRTDTLPEDELERFGISLGKTLSISQIQANQRLLRDVELEGRQKLWQWLILTSLLLLALETWLGGWLSRRQSPVSEQA